MRVGGQKIHVLHRRRKRAERLDRVEAEQNAALAQKFSDGVVFQPEAADEMAGRERDEPRVFVHLSHHVLRADDAEAARVEQAHFDALRPPAPSTDRRSTDNRRGKSGCCRPCEISVRRRRSSTRARSGRRARFRPAGSSAIARRACARRPAGACTKASWSPSVLPCAQSEMASATRRGSGQTPACARKILSRATGNSLPAQFLVGEQISVNVMRQKLICAGPGRKAELKSVQDVGKVAVCAIKAGIKLDDFVGDDQHDEEINEPRHPGGEGIELVRAFFL